MKGQKQPVHNRCSQTVRWEGKWSAERGQSGGQQR